MSFAWIGTRDHGLSLLRHALSPHMYICERLSCPWYATTRLCAPALDRRLSKRMTWFPKSAPAEVVLGRLLFAEQDVSSQLHDTLQSLTSANQDAAISACSVVLGISCVTTLSHSSWASCALVLIPKSIHGW